MSVSSTDYIKRYTGDAATVAYSFPYYASANTDISVDIDDVVQSSGFTTTGSASSWTVTFVTPPAVGETVVLYRETTNKQESDYVTNDAIPDDVIEADFDKRTAVSQEIDGERARSIKIPRSEVPTDDNTLLSSATARASMVLGFDSGGDLSLVSPETAGAVEGTGVLSTGETGGTKFLREDGDGTCSWQTPAIVPVATLADDATPSVLLGQLFKTGGTTTITDFDDGVVGQTIRILSEHAITITDNAAIILNGSANFVMATSDCLTLTMFNDQIWEEVSRKVNL